MAHKNKIKTRKYLRDSIKKKWEKGKGKEKHKYKDEHNSTPFIHSYSTYKTYLNECDKFSDWAHENGYTRPDEAKEHIPDYLSMLEADNKSAWTISTSMNALAKGYGISTTDIPYQAPKRRRRDITRSRLDVANDKHFSEKNNKEIVTFQKCFGLRKDKELSVVRGSDFLVTADGKIKCHIKGKGGKWRWVEFYGNNKEKEIILDLLNKRDKGLLFPNIPSAFDAHYYRGIYAKRVYLAHENKNNLDYHCRGDMRGISFDRNALKIASKMLGHNRACVVVDNYLYNLKTQNR